MSLPLSRLPPIKKGGFLSYPLVGYIRGGGIIGVLEVSNKLVNIMESGKDIVNEELGELENQASDALAKINALEDRGAPEGYESVDPEYFHVEGTGYTDRSSSNAGIPVSINTGNLSSPRALVAKIDNKYIWLGGVMTTNRVPSIKESDLPDDQIILSSGDVVSTKYRGGDYFTILDGGNILALNVNGDPNAIVFYKKTI